MSKFYFNNFWILFFVFVLSPKLAMVVVKKRGNARFFARDPCNNLQLTNPPPGTIIDHTVTNQGLYFIS